MLARAFNICREINFVSFWFSIQFGFSMLIIEMAFFGLTKRNEYLLKIFSQNTPKYSFVVINWILFAEQIESWEQFHITNQLSSAMIRNLNHIFAFETVRFVCFDGFVLHENPHSEKNRNQWKKYGQSINIFTLKLVKILLDPISYDIRYSGVVLATHHTFGHFLFDHSLRVSQITLTSSSSINSQSKHNTKTYFIKMTRNVNYILREKRIRFETSLFPMDSNGFQWAACITKANTFADGIPWKLKSTE